MAHESNFEGSPGSNEQYDKRKIRSLILLVSKIQSQFRKKDVRNLKKVYHEIINDIVIDFNPFEFRLAIIVHMLTKFISKPRLWKRPGIAGLTRKIDSALSDFIFFSKKDNLTRMLSSLDKITYEINDLDAYDKKYVGTLMENTKVKIAATMYAKGVSLSVASENTGIPSQRILGYAGKTMMADRLMAGVSVKKRLSWLDEMIE